MAKFEDDLNLSLLMIYQIFNILPKNINHEIPRYQMPKILHFLKKNWIRDEVEEDKDMAFEPEIKIKLNFMISHWNKFSNAQKFEIDRKLESGELISLFKVSILLKWLKFFNK